ncbi:uncharacterized protein LOC143293159 [Babylonia areolata]|uniref:uncharacterized protein LOC143293159 n=1 Tax=Babylonia areolata TaxID=304850 RepID=UPI003FD0E0D9
MFLLCVEVTCTPPTQTADMSTIRRAYMEISNGIRGLRLHRDQSPPPSVSANVPTPTTTTSTTTTTTSISLCSTLAATTSTTITTTISSALSSFSTTLTNSKSSLLSIREASSLTSQMQASASATAAAIRKTIQRGAEGSSAMMAGKFSRSPKAGIARRIRRLNQSLNGREHRISADSISELMMDARFVGRFFLYFSPAERGTLCRVCKKWRKILYSPKYWSDAMPVISYRHWRYSHDPAERKHVYDSILQRGFDSVCLFGATDEDAGEFACHFQTGKSHHLRSLCIRCANITDAGLEVLFRKMASSINHLELSGCNEVTESGLWTCLNAKIVSLCIMDCINVADDTVGAIAQLLPSLYELKLQAYHVTDAALALFSPKQSYTLHVLRLTSCWEVTNNGLVNIVRTLPNLSVLGLSGCSKVSDDGVELLADNLRRLRVLDLSWCPRISDVSLEYIACDLTLLEELVLDRCPMITDTGVGYLSTMGSLHKVFLRYCHNVRDPGLRHLYSMRKLSHLSLAGCSHVSPNALCGLTRLPNLTELELSNCPSATQGVVRYLRENLYRCLVIH